MMRIQIRRNEKGWFSMQVFNFYEIIKSDAAPPC